MKVGRTEVSLICLHFTSHPLELTSLMQLAGIVQRSTGRILFFFNGEAFVCTGTVVGDKVQDRTVIVSSLRRSRAYTVTPLLTLIHFATANRRTLRL